MLSTIVISTAMVALAAAQNPYNTVVNNTPNPIAYAFTGPYDSLISGGSIPPGASQDFELGTSYNVKMCYSCDPTAASSGILQFEFDLDSSTQVSYDWSLINGPNPFSGYEYSITPWDGGCPTLDCQPGDTSNDCQYTTYNDFNPPTCDIGGQYPVLTAVIG